MFPLQDGACGAVPGNRQDVGKPIGEAQSRGADFKVASGAATSARRPCGIEARAAVAGEVAPGAVVEPFMHHQLVASLD